MRKLIFSFLEKLVALLSVLYGNALKKEEKKKKAEKRAGPPKDNYPLF
jgi:hypothetical protein